MTRRSNGSLLVVAGRLKVRRLGPDLRLKIVYCRRKEVDQRNQTRMRVNQRLELRTVSEDLLAAFVRCLRFVGHFHCLRKLINYRAYRYYFENLLIPTSASAVSAAVSALTAIASGSS